MKVKRIYSRDVIRAPRSVSLQEAAILMRQHHVGLLVVTDDEPNEDRAIGVVTDRDMVLQAIAEGVAPTEASVGDVMTQGLHSVSENADLFEALETMRAHGVRRLTVSAGEGTLVGVVTLDDIIDAFGAEVASLAGVIRGGRAREGV